MQRNPVTSTNIKPIEYNKNTKTLESEFKNGGLYRYSSVPENIYNNLMNADSHGEFLAIFIKGKYPCVKLK